MVAISTDSLKGIRDKAMLMLLYDSGARVQAIADLTIRDLRLDAGKSLIVFAPKFTTALE